METKRLRRTAGIYSSFVVAKDSTLLISFSNPKVQTHIHMVQTHIHMHGVEVFDKLLHCFVRFVFERAGCAGEISSEYHQLITTLFALCEFPTFGPKFSRQKS